MSSPITWCSRWSASTGCTATSTCPQLQHAGGLLGYIQRQLGLPIASTAPLGKITDAFSRGDAPLRPRPAGAVGGLRQGPAQGRRHARTPRPVRPARRGCCSSGGRRRRPRCSAPSAAATPHGESYPWIVQRHRGGQPVLRLRRRRRLRAVLPQVLLLLPLQRQAVPQRPRVGQTAGREGRDRVHRAGQRVRHLRRPGRACRRSATGSGPEQIDALLRKWLAILPHPFTAADRAAGYRYDISIWQAEFSLTQVLDRPVSGRVFFEHVIRDNLDTGRPDQVSLIFDRRLIHGRGAHPGPVPHPGDHRGRHPEPAHRLQAHHDQAVPQGRPRAADRDHDQRHPRLRDRETADQSARPAGDRPLRQPAPAGRPTTQPQPDPRRGSLHRRARPDHHRHRARASPGSAWATAAPTPCCKPC